VCFYLVDSYDLTWLTKYDSILLMNISWSNFVDKHMKSISLIRTRGSHDLWFSWVLLGWYDFYEFRWIYVILSDWKWASVIFDEFRCFLQLNGRYIVTTKTWQNINDQDSNFVCWWIRKRNQISVHRWQKEIYPISQKESDTWRSKTS
jgi:hypothetical protein